MFETLLVRPVINVLIAIYALVPGHNFGVAIIIFTIFARMALWPLVRKQLHHAKAMRELQPEIKKIKKSFKGDKQAEAAATMALYKEREISPFSGIGYLIVQLPIIIALYQGVTKIADDPNVLLDKAYGFVGNLPWMQELALDITKFDSTLFGQIDLTARAVGENSVSYGLLLIVVASAAVQYFSSKQLIATQGEKKSLRKLLKQQSDGEEVDQADIMQAVSSTTIYFIPVLIFFVSLGFVGALPFYWLINGIIAYFQQRRALNSEVSTLTASVEGEVIEAEIEAPKKETSEPKKKLNAKQKKEARAKSKNRVKKSVKTKKG